MPDGTDMLFYGFNVDLHAIQDNDYIIDFSHMDEIGNPDILEIYRQGGETQEDAVASQIEHLTDPFAMDIETSLAEFRRTNDPKTITWGFLHDVGIRTAWIVPINTAWSGGFGVLNHFLFEKEAPPPIPQNQLIPLALEFHDAVRKAGLLAKKLGLTAIERRTLSLFARGKTSREIAEAEEANLRAIERRLERARRKLKASNSAEAIYKGMLYGAIPYR